MSARQRDSSNGRSSWLADFDERLWPIHGAVGLLAGLITVVAIADSRFDEPRLLYNAWLRVGVAAAVVLVLVIASLWLRSRAARRALLCMLLSLLAHVGFGVFAHHQYLTTRADRPEPSHDAAEEPATEAPSPDFKFEYVETAPERSTFDEPVEVEIPAEAATTKIARQESEKISLPRDETVPAERAPLAKLSTVAIQPADRTTPPVAELASASPITRHELPHPPDADSPIPQPVILPSSEPTVTLGPSVAVQSKADPKPTAAPPRPVLAMEPISTPAAPMELARLTPRPIPADQPSSMPADQSSQPARSAIAPPPTPVEPIELPAIIESHPSAALHLSSAEAAATRSQTTDSRAALSRPDEESRQLTAMTRQTQLPAAVAPRKESPAASRPDDTSAVPMSLTRAPSGIDLPSAIVARLPTSQSHRRPAARRPTPSNRPHPSKWPSPKPRRHRPSTPPTCWPATRRLLVRKPRHRRPPPRCVPRRFNAR